MKPVSKARCTRRTVTTAAPASAPARRTAPRRQRFRPGPRPPVPTACARHAQRHPQRAQYDEAARSTHAPRRAWCAQASGARRPAPASASSARTHAVPSLSCLPQPPAAPPASRRGASGSSPADVLDRADVRDGAPTDHQPSSRWSATRFSTQVLRRQPAQRARRASHGLRLRQRDARHVRIVARRSVHRELPWPQADLEHPLHPGRSALASGASSAAALLRDSSRSSSRNRSSKIAASPSSTRRGTGRRTRWPRRGDGPPAPRASPPGCGACCPRGRRWNSRPARRHIDPHGARRGRAPGATGSGRRSAAATSSAQQWRHALRCRRPTARPTRARGSSRVARRGHPVGDPAPRAHAGNVLRMVAVVAGGVLPSQESAAQQSLGQHSGGSARSGTVDHPRPIVARSGSTASVRAAVLEEFGRLSSCRSSTSRARAGEVLVRLVAVASPTPTCTSPRGSTVGYAPTGSATRGEHGRGGRRRRTVAAGRRSRRDPVLAAIWRVRALSKYQDDICLAIHRSARP